MGKAALARVSPLLIAEPTEEGVNLLIATGLVDGTAKFTSVRAATIFKRCERAFPPFRANDARQFAEARNDYLHGAEPGFVAMPANAWWPKYWALASILVTAQDRDMEDLVGPDRVDIVDSYLKQNARNIEHRTESLISRAKQRLAQFEAGTLSAKIQAEWRSNPNLSREMKFSTLETCPACASPGRLEGEDGGDVEYEVDYSDDGEPISAIARVSVLAEYFSCSRCHLILDGYELLAQAGLPEDFDAIDNDPEWPEPEYGND